MNYPFEVLSTDAKVNATIEMEDGGIIKLELYTDIAPISVTNRSPSEDGTIYSFAILFSPYCQ